jgi:ABC-2 type transport system permease protein
MTVLHQLWAFVRRDYLLASASRLTILWQFVTVLFAAPTLYYLGRLIPPASSPDLRPYGGNYFAFVILGIAFSGFFSTMMGAWASGMRNEQVRGTLEAVLVNPVGVLTVAAGGSLWAAILGALHTGVYLAVAAWVFHVTFARANLLAALAAAGLTAAVYASLGMMAAGITLVTRHPDPLTGIVTGISVLAAGVFYPVTILTPPLQRLAQWIPLTHTLQAVRLAVLSGVSIPALAEELVTLLLLGVMLAPLGLGVLYAAIGLARRQGALRAR